MSLPRVVVSYSCPECGRTVVRRTRRRDGNPFLGCTGYPKCRWTSDYDAATQALGKRIRELEARLDDFEDAAGAVTAKDIRAVLAWAHPDKHPDGTLPVHEVAVRLSELFDKARGSA